MKKIKRTHFTFKTADHLFCVGRVLNAPVDIVWRVITDTKRWTEWGPSVVKVSCNSRFISSGSTGRVHTVLGFSLPFSITAYEYNKEWKWRVGGINATGHRIVPATDDACILYFDIPIWAMPYSIVCWMALKQIEKIIQTMDKSLFFDEDK